MTDTTSASSTAPQTQAVTVQPYELLIRYGTTGAIVGAHAQNQMVITDAGGAVLGVTLQAPASISVAGQAGFPLAAVLPQVQAGAIQAMDVAQAQLADNQALLTALQQQLGQAQQALSQSQAQVAALQASVAAADKPKA